jgi:zinc D-Ala-D-Ala carboxypeptidase
MTTRTLALALLMAFTAAAAAPVLARVAQSIPVGPPPPAGLPECRYADEPAARTGYDEWRDTLLDTIFTLGPDYVPPDLVLVELPGGRIALRELVVEDLLLMLEAARAEGIEITVASGYRSYRKQASVFEFVARTEGQAQALRSVARPGHSEHQLGTAIDFKGGAQWLRENAWRFGFVLSYPQGRSPAWTCYMPEPWHYRYFGRELAAEIHASGLSPREWLWAQQDLVDARSLSAGAM